MTPTPRATRPRTRGAHPDGPNLSLADVLANVAPGRHVRLHLNPVQKQALADRDGRILCEVLRALLQARHAATAASPAPPPYSFPLTEHALQAVAAKLGHRVGIKRARAMIRRAIACQLLEPAGHYRTCYKQGGDGGGHRVRLYKPGAPIVGLRRRLCLKPAVGSGRPVKQERLARPTPWWAHSWFGDYGGLPPPQLTRAQRRQMRSDDELQPTWR